MYICRLVQSRVFNSQQCSFSTSGDACILGHEERVFSLISYIRNYLLNQSLNLHWKQQQI